jgi:hypothetical protein
VPTATAILDRFLHHAEIVSITGKSYRLRNQNANGGSGGEPARDSKPAISPAGAAAPTADPKRSKNKPTAGEEDASSACQS